MSGAGIAVAASGLRRSYRGRTVLDVDSLDLPAGRTTVVLGPSGSGKSTLLGIVGLLEPPEAGTVTFDGAAVDWRDHEARRRTAAVFQRPFLFKGSIGDNVAYGLKLRGVPAAERAGRVADALALVGLEGWADRSALTLSGGEGQRVALARALVLEPDLLMLDEPLASLDPLLRNTLGRDFAALFRALGTTVLWVTHDQDEALTVADRVVVLNKGTVVSAGPTDLVMGLAHDEWTAAFLGTETAARGVVSASEEGLACIELGEAAVFALTDLPLRSEVLVGIRPEDVLLFEHDAELPASSARNRVPMRVVAIEPRGATARVTLERGRLRLASSVSRASVESLALAEGVDVLAVFKATAVRVRRADSPSGTPEGTIGGPAEEAAR